MSSQIMHSQLSNIHHLAHILGTWALISVLRPFHSLPQPYHVTASHLSTGDKPQSAGGRSEWTQESSKNGRVNSIVYIFIRTLHYILSVAPCRAASTVIHPFAIIMPSITLLRTKPLVQLLLHLDTSSPLSQILYAEHTFQRSPCSIPLILSVHHIPFTLSIRCHLQARVLKTIHFLSLFAIYCHMRSTHIKNLQCL